TPKRSNGWQRDTARGLPDTTASEEGPTAMTTRILLVALGIAWAVALAGLVWMMTLAMMRPHHALLSFIVMDPTLKICVALSVASAAFGISSGLAGLRVRARLGVGGALGWGVVGALLGA